MNKLRIRFAESKQQCSHKVENTCIKDPFSTLWEHFCFNSIPCKPFFLVLMNFRQTIKVPYAISICFIKELIQLIKQTI